MPSACRNGGARQRDDTSRSVFSFFCYERLTKNLAGYMVNPTRRLQKNIKHWLRRNSFHLPQLPLIRYACDLYLDAHYGNTDASMQSNGEAEFLRSIIPTEKTTYTVFDVGANIGNWTREVLKLNPSIKAHCFEPSFETFRTLSRSLPDTVTCRNIAFGSQIGSSAFFVYGEGNVHNSFFNHESFRVGTKTEVPVDKLDDYCEREDISRVDFLKVDVEGAEFQVLQGASALLSTQRIGIIQFEYGSKWIDARVFLRDIYEFFEDFDYAIWKLIPGGKLRPLPHYDYRYEQFRHSTFILTAPGISLG